MRRKYSPLSTLRTLRKLERIEGKLLFPLPVSVLSVCSVVFHTFIPLNVEAGLHDVVHADKTDDL
jgi:hypothetical protein